VVEPAGIEPATSSLQS